MGFEVRRVDHDRLDIPTLGGQFGEDAGKDTQPAPAHPSVVERLGRAIGRRRIPPSQPIAVDEDNPAQNLPVIHARHPVRQRKMWLEPLHLRLGQPEQIIHMAPPWCPE